MYLFMSVRVRLRAQCTYAHTNARTYKQIVATLADSGEIGLAPGSSSSLSICLSICLFVDLSLSFYRTRRLICYLFMCPSILSLHLSYVSVCVSSSLA